MTLEMRDLENQEIGEKRGYGIKPFIKTPTILIMMDEG